jgi:hypothetical protein
VKSLRKMRVVSSPGIAAKAANISFLGPRGIQVWLFVVLGLLVGFLYVFNFTTFF